MANGEMANGEWRIGVRQPAVPIRGSLFAIRVSPEAEKE